MKTLSNVAQANTIILKLNKLPVELYGAHIASTTYIPYSKFII